MRKKTQSFYLGMSDIELQSFRDMLHVFQKLVLSMIRNAVYALPENNAIKSTNSITSLSSTKKSLKKAKYANFTDVKNVFLSCVADGKKRIFLERIIDNLTINNKKQIAFRIKQYIYRSLDLQSKKNLSTDIKKLEKIINTTNNDFNKMLPSAKRHGVLVRNKINANSIPSKAKYIEKVEVRY